MPTFNRLEYKDSVCAVARERVIFFHVCFVFGSLSWSREGGSRVWECFWFAP